MGSIAIGIVAALALGGTIGGLTGRGIARTAFRWRRSPQQLPSGSDAYSVRSRANVAAASCMSATLFAYRGNVDQEVVGHERYSQVHDYEDGNGPDRLALGQQPQVRQ